MSKKPTYEELEQEVKALRKTVSKNEYLERVYHSIGQSIIILDSDQNILSANLATEKLMGLSSDEMKGKKCYQIFHDPEATSPVEFCPMQKALSTGKTETMEMEVETVKGTFLVSCTPIFDHNSKLKRAIHVSTDITESKRTKEALKDSEARLKALSEASFESIFLSEKGICIDQNQTAIRTFGYTHAEALGRHGTEWIIPEDRELVKNNMLSGYEKPYEVTALRKDGTTFPCEIQARMIDYQGQPIRTTALRDITDRKRLEEDFRALAENANDGILIAVEYGKLSYVNRRTSEITGYSVSELLKMTIRDLAHPDEFEKINKRHKTIIAGKPFQRQFETMIIRKDGKEIPIELSSAMFIWHGQPADMVVIRDIADRKQAEEALLESEKKHRSIIENLPMGIHMYQLEPDGELHFIGANSAADEILGVDNTQFLGKTIYEAFPKIQETEIPERFRIIAEEGGFWKKEDIIYKDENIEGAFENYNFQTSPGKMVSLFSDITDRKQAEEALQQAHDKLEQRVKERTNELERKSRSIEDVNTALNVMLKKRDADKLMIEERVLFNVKELIEPLIENLKKNGLNENQNGYVNALETFLAEIVSPFSQTLHTKFLNLTLSEIRVANLIKEGKTTKEIASLLNSTPRAIEFHRQNLRKKLGLSSRKANLGSHLLSLID